jgi:hypothetical protein
MINETKIQICFHVRKMKNVLGISVTVAVTDGRGIAVYLSELPILNNSFLFLNHVCQYSRAWS